MENEEDPKDGTFSFKYIFPNDLKELHVNGAYGGLGPDGTIRMGVYSERGAIPNVEKHIINPDKTIGGTVKLERKYDVVRIIQASLVFNVSTAKSFVDWLSERINEHEKLKEEIGKALEKRGSE
jgi:hypothetical protein